MRCNTEKDETNLTYTGRNKGIMAFSTLKTANYSEVKCVLFLVPSFSFFQIATVRSGIRLPLGDKYLQLF